MKPEPPSGWKLVGADGEPFRPCAGCMPEEYAAWKRDATAGRAL